MDVPAESPEPATSSAPTVVSLAGEWDLNRRDELRAVLAEFATGDHACKDIVLDLTRTTFIDSTTIGVLIDAHRDDGLDFTVRGATGEPRKLLEVLNLTEVFSIDD
jgi:anti-anti-sigma factor